MNLSPVAIVGAERSGTTLLRLMLHQHPQISVCPEMEFIVDPLAQTNTWPSVQQLQGALQANWLFRIQGFKIDSTLTWKELANSLLDQFQQCHPCNHILIVVHRNFDQLIRLWPTIRYIHIVRDPRDVARSVLGMGWEGNVWHGVQRWLTVESMWEQMRRTLALDQFLEVQYEELVALPAATLQKICEFIGTTFTPDMLNYPDHSSYAAPDLSLVGQWQHKLSPREVALVEHRAGSLLELRHYQASGVESLDLSWLDLSCLRLDNWLKRVLFRYQQLGPKLFVEDYASRQLPLKRWRDSVDDRLYQSWANRLK